MQPSRARLATLSALALVCGAAHADVTFDFTKGSGLLALEATDPGKAAAIYDGAVLAGSIWSGILKDRITVRIELDYDPSLPSVGGAFGGGIDRSYASVKGALIGDVKSGMDALSSSKLQPGPFVGMRINDTTMVVPPPGAGFLPYFDDDGSANNETMWISRANAKALGLLAAHHVGSDGTLKFGAADFDFDYVGGIDSDAKDFTGTALHEIGHLLGFYSGVDGVASLLPPELGGIGGDQDEYWLVNTLDLFRYSLESVALGEYIPDLSLPTPGSSPMRYFSIDGGLTPMVPFSTGKALLGDGKQASHWKDDVFGPWWGLMDPTLGDGFPLTDMFLSSAAGAPFDIFALDVIGWDLVPAPGTLAIAGLASLGLGRRRRA